MAAADSTAAPLRRIARLRTAIGAAGDPRARRAAAGELMALLEAAPWWAADGEAAWLRALMAAPGPSPRAERPAAAAKSAPAQPVPAGSVRKGLPRARQRQGAGPPQPVPPPLLRLLARASEERPRGWSTAAVVEAVVEGLHSLQREEVGAAAVPHNDGRGSSWWPCCPPARPDG